MEVIRNFLLTSKKAVAGFVAAGVLGALRLLDIELLPDATEGLRVFVEGVIVAVVVWLSPKNDEGRQ